MEKKEATKVGCQSCKSNKGVIKTQRFLMGLGLGLFVFAVYGIYNFIKLLVNFL